MPTLREALDAEVTAHEATKRELAAAIERGIAIEEKYQFALNACHIGLKLNDEYRGQLAASRALVAAKERGLGEISRFSRTRSSAELPGDWGELADLADTALALSEADTEEK